MRLQDKNVLITGGSAGVGAAVARKFVAEGANVAINYASSRDRADALREALLADSPSTKIVLLQGDVSQTGTCTKLVAETIAQLGSIDCIVSNAGWTKFADWADLDALSEDEWDKTFAINVKAHLYLFKAAKPHFNENKEGGNMIMTTSVAGIKQSGSALAYSVTKHAAQALARGLALHQGPKCRINTVAPGLLETDWATQQFGRERIDAHRASLPLKMVSCVISDDENALTDLDGHSGGLCRRISSACDITIYDWPNVRHLIKETETEVLTV